MSQVSCFLLIDLTYVTLCFILSKPFFSFSLPSNFILIHIHSIYIAPTIQLTVQKVYLCLIPDKAIFLDFLISFLNQNKTIYAVLQKWVRLSCLFTCLKVQGFALITPSFDKTAFSWIYASIMLCISVVWSLKFPCFQTFICHKWK